MFARLDKIVAARFGWQTEAANDQKAQPVANKPRRCALVLSCRLAADEEMWQFRQLPLDWQSFPPIGGIDSCRRADKQTAADNC